MGQGVADQLNNHCGDGFVAYDAHLREEVFVIPCFVYIIADTPMANALSCTINSGSAIHPCRICHVSSKIEGEESLKAWFEVCIRQFETIDYNVDKTTCRKGYQGAERKQKLLSKITSNSLSMGGPVAN